MLFKSVSFALTISLLHAYIYLPILPSTCTSNMYINANHKLVYHYLTYVAILQSATWTVYAICKFLSTHLKPATRGRIRFKIDFSYLDFVYATHLFSECQSVTLIIGDTYWPAQLYSRRYFLKTTDRLTVCQKGEDMWLEGLESMTSATFPKNRRQSATLLDLN